MNDYEMALAQWLDGDIGRRAQYQASALQLEVLVIGSDEVLAGSIAKMLMEESDICVTLQIKGREIPGYYGDDVPLKRICYHIVFLQTSLACYDEVLSQAYRADDRAFIMWFGDDDPPEEHLRSPMILCQAGREMHYHDLRILQRRFRGIVDSIRGRYIPKRRNPAR